MQTSAVPGIDPSTGALPDSPAVQFALAFSNLARLLELAGASPDDVGLLTIFIPGREYRAFINGPWLEMFPGPDRPARKTNQAPLPDGMYVQLQATAAPGGDRRSLELPGLGHRDPLPMGATAGGLVASSVLGGEDPTTGMAPPDASDQLELAFGNLGRLMARAGAGPGQVNHLWVFLRDFSLTSAMLEAYLRAFPNEGDRPARKTVPYALPEGVHVQVQATGWTGGRRRNLELPGIGHHDPIPLASQTGPLLQSSGLHGLDPATSRMVGGGMLPETDAALRNLDALMEQAGGGLTDILSLTVLVRSFAAAEPIQARLAALFGDAGRVPPLQFVRYALPEDLNVQFHLSAMIEEA